MTDPATLRTAFLEELVRIAPDLSPGEIGPHDHLQEDLDLDSMDILRLVTALHARLGIDIPEADYPHIATLESAVAYLAGRAP